MTLCQVPDDRERCDEIEQPRRHDHDAVSMFWFSISASVVSILCAIPDWRWPTPIDWLWLILLGWVIHLWSILDAALFKPSR